MRDIGFLVAQTHRADEPLVFDRSYERQYATNLDHFR